VKRPWEKTLPFIFLAVVVLLAIQFYPTPKERRPGEIYLSTIPSGADIYMLQAGSIRGFNKKFLARSPGPLPVDIKERTRFTLTLELFGYHVEDLRIRQADLAAGPTIELRPKWGILSAMIYLARDYRYLLSALLLSFLFGLFEVRPQRRFQREQEELWRSGKLQPGLQLHEYQLVEKLGEGASGAVFRALKARSDPNRSFTLKVLLRDAGREPHELEETLNRELRTCAALGHPGIVDLHGWGVFRDYYYLVSEFVPGDTLDRVGRSSLADVCRWGIQITAALTYAHSQGVVHRDIKPANIIRTRDNQVKILDFGIAAQVGSAEESGAGSVGYMAPEQASGEVSAACDFYALGVTLYRLASASMPFQGEDLIQVLAAQAIGKYEPLDSLIDCPAEFLELIDGLLQKEPRDRPDAEQIQILLEASLRCLS